MYLQEQLGGANYNHVAADLDDLSGAAVHSTSLGVTSQIKVKRIAVLVTTVTVGAATVAFKRYPTYGSSSGAVTIGSVVIPGGTAAGKVVYKDVSPVVCFPGDQIVYEVTSAATSGAGMYAMESELDPEAPANQSDMIASA